MREWSYKEGRPNYSRINLDVCKILAANEKTRGIKGKKEIVVALLRPWNIEVWLELQDHYIRWLSQLRNVTQATTVCMDRTSLANSLKQLSTGRR